MVSDYRMPNYTGLDLVDWLLAKEAQLATIILTAEGEKELVAESLRRGVVDFLEKPVSLPKLLGALEKAMDRTRLQRELARSNSAVKNLGRTQLWLLQPNRVAEGKFHLDICFHPILEAGGDFVDQMQVRPGLHCCLLTDVSGHDLRAAYISAYFHGIFRGMFMRLAPLPEILGYFNDFLVKEWNQPGRLQNQNFFGTSLAIVALLLEPEGQMASVIVCGAPMPVWVSADARAQMIGEVGGAPLGWFPEVEISGVRLALAGGGVIYAWTDGLVDLAEEHEVHPLCLAFALQQAKQNDRKLPWLAEAKDDILLATITFPARDGKVGGRQPLVLEKYQGDEFEEIDELVAGWRRNLKLAAPDLSEAAEHDILLATREAVLNGMDHGCQHQAGKCVSLQISIEAERREIQVWVDDPGEGHQFDFEAHAAAAAAELIDEHRGLIFIKNLATRMKWERNGASLILEFDL